MKIILKIYHTFICIKKHEISEVCRARVVELVEFGWYN